MMKRNAVGEIYHDVGNAAVFSVNDYASSITFNVYVKLLSGSIGGISTGQVGEIFYNKTSSEFTSPIYSVGLISQPFSDARIIVAIDPRAKPPQGSYNLEFSSGSITWDGGPSVAISENTVYEVSSGSHGIFLFADGEIAGSVSSWSDWSKGIVVSYEGY